MKNTLNELTLALITLTEIINRLNLLMEDKTLIGGIQPEQHQKFIHFQELGCVDYTKAPPL